MNLNWLYLDLNSYFASVEQQINKQLRNKPIAIVPTLTDATCAIAASYEAKAYGIKTGTMIYEAKRLCPKLICVQANHKNYVEYHHKILEEINKYIPIEIIASIDEVACKLVGKQQKENEARNLANKIKENLQKNIGEYIRCSIGIAPNRFLAKTASNLEKPNGLQVLYSQDIPRRIKHFKLSDLTGIGHAIEKRLNIAGVLSIEELFKLSPKHMRKLWGNVHGERFWYMLRGIEIPTDETQRSTIGHSHVLDPKLRRIDLAKKVMNRLLLKAASRLRRLNYYTNTLNISFRIENGLKVKGTKKFYRSCDNITLLKQGTEIWNTLIRTNGVRRVKKINITFLNLEKKSELQPDFFETTLQTKTNNKFESLSKAMDKINIRFGRDSIAIGNIPSKVQAFSGTKIAFTRIPDRKEFNE